MSSMGKLTFFLGFQVKQKQDGIFISQDKYVAEILKKYGFTKVKNASTAMETQKHLLKDKDGVELDVHIYRSMIGSLMYLTSLKHDIMFAVCACARYQLNLKVSHLYDVKRIFRKTKRKDTQVPQLSILTESVANEAVYKELDDSLVRVATTASSLEVEQDSGVNTPQSDEDSVKLNKLMELCITLQSRVLDLEQTKNTQANKIDSLKKKVKKLEKKQRSRTHKLKRLYKVGLTAKVEPSDDKQSLDLHGEEMFATKQDENVIEKEVDVAQVQPKAERIVLQEPSESRTTTTTTISSKKSQDKGWKSNSLKNKSFDNIQELFNKAMKKMNTFVDYKTELVEESSKKAKAEVIKGSSKRAGTELEQESSKKQKIDDGKETTKLTKLVKIIPDEEGVAIDAIPLAVKPPSIVD
nr:hypothetical protein [Tanacetum cinerariifolium]